VTEKQRQCRCGAIYHRTEAMASSREIDSFECVVCGTTLETWATAWVPTYRLVSAPEAKPDAEDPRTLSAAGKPTQPPQS
jgi:hypothetical protein